MIFYDITDFQRWAFLLVPATGEGIKMSEVALRQAKGNLSMDEGRYSTGVSNASELGDAQMLYTESRNALVQSVYQQHKAMAKLEFSAGGEL